jgi:glycerophosphoryl diester phosphodiesterase
MIGSTRVHPIGTPPLVLAHRGASAYAPENTQAAFDLALEIGAPAFETDVRATADGHLVLLHDERVDRTTDGTGSIASLTLAQVQALDAGSWFDSRFAGERIPTLQGFLCRYGNRIRLRLEVKGINLETQLLIAVDSAGRLNQVEFSSFSWEAVERLCALCREARVGWLVQAVDAVTICRAVGVGARFLSGRADLLTPQSLRDGRAAGLEVGAWGVRDDELLEKVVRMGVDSFTSNWPDRALRRVGADPGTGNSPEADSEMP